jgi:hypothetical protein
VIAWPGRLHGCSCLPINIEIFWFGWSPDGSGHWWVQAALNELLVRPPGVENTGSEVLRGPSLWELLPVLVDLGVVSEDLRDDCCEVWARWARPTIDRYLRRPAPLARWMSSVLSWCDC